MSQMKLPVNSAGITNFQRDPVGKTEQGKGNAVAITYQNKIAFYCVPPSLYARYVEHQEYAELNHIADERLKGGGGL